MAPPCTKLLDVSLKLGVDVWARSTDLGLSICELPILQMVTALEENSEMYHDLKDFLWKEVQEAPRKAYKGFQGSQALRSLQRRFGVGAAVRKS